MYFVMALKLNEGHKKHVSIPMHWCFGINMEMVMRKGMSKTEDLKIFYSKNETRLPNFDLPIQRAFRDEDSCYVARFRTCISK